jgi:hypothetical protein
LYNIKKKKFFGVSVSVSVKCQIYQCSHHRSTLDTSLYIIYVCMNVCMYVATYMCMYTCIYVPVYLYM